MPISAMLLLATGCAGGETAPAAPDRPPSVLLIVADDLGYADIAPFGGDIDTPTLSGLAADGLSMFSFYAAPMCAPARAMLLTGLDSHVVGLGVMTRPAASQVGQPGYEGYLNERVPSAAEVLQAAGYDTYMAGKWHLGMGPGQLPGGQGFDHSFALAEGLASHYPDAATGQREGPVAHYFRDDVPVSLPADFYSSEAFADALIGHLKAQSPERPFFAYLSFTAPHDPLHAPPEWIDRYAGRFDEGYTVRWEERIAAMRSLGVLPAGARPGHSSRVRPWSALSAQDRQHASRRMEVYAAMVEGLDHQIGRVLDVLRQQDRLSDTLVIFLSDNGAAGRETGPYRGRGAQARSWFEQTFDNSLENIGRPGSFASVGAGWAQSSTAPLRELKTSAAEGGIRSAFIAAGPGVGRKGADLHTVGHVMDIPPTLYDLAGVAHPAPLTGRSMVRFLAGSTDVVHEEAIGWELHGAKALRKGDLKILWETDRWALYNLREDPGETTDLSAAQPDRLAELVADWARYVADSGVIEARR